MNLRLTIPLAMAALIPMGTLDAQNLFRQARPNYARQGNIRAQSYPSPSGSWSRPAVADRYAEAIGRTPGISAARPAIDRDQLDDYRRLQLAWDDYRREASRYQQRYGGSTTVSNDSFDSFSNDRFTEPATCACQTRNSGQRESETYPVEPYPGPNDDVRFNAGDAADFRPRLQMVPRGPAMRGGQVPYRPSGTTRRSAISPPAELDLGRTAYRPVAADWLRWLATSE